MTTTVRIQRTIKAPIEDVFDAYTDHASWVRVPLIQSAKVVKPGRTEPNGSGAIREVFGAGAWFREEITDFERPYRMGYQILKSIPPIRHELGIVEFTETNEGTLVTWTSRFASKLPLPGLSEPVFKQVATVGFGAVLRWLDKQLSVKA